MNGSEFVVLDNDHDGSIDLHNFCELVQAYGVERDSLLKGVLLLDSTINIITELALKNNTCDPESNFKDHIKRILGSSHASPEVVLRTHVQSLCSKLISVEEEYAKLANNYKSLTSEKLSKALPPLERLSNILAQTDSLLSSLSDAQGPAPINNGELTTNVEDLCTRMQSIQDRVKMVTEARSGFASDSANPPNQQNGLKDSEANSSEQAHCSAPKVESDMHYFLSPHLASLNLIRKTSSEVSLYHSQCPQHVVTPSHYYQHQTHHVDYDRQPHHLPPPPLTPYQRDSHIISNARHSLVIDDGICLPNGHVQRLKKKLSASLTESGSEHVQNDLRAIPRQIFGAKELFGASTTLFDSTALSSPSGAASSSPPPTQPPVPRRQSTRDEIISLQKNVASLAAAAALQRNVSVRAKEVIIDGRGVGSSSDQVLVAPRPFPSLSLPKLPTSVQTQTDLSGSCPWWMIFERQNSVSSVTSSGIGMDDGANFQDDYSSVSKTSFVTCKQNSFYPTHDFLQEV